VAAAASGPSRFLFISNGHGEDVIAAAIVARLPGSVSVEAYPMIGTGNAYAGVCPIVGPRASVPSGGARTARGSLRRDVAAGGLGTFPPALRFLRKVRGHYDRLVVIGDMVGVIAAYLMGLRELIYIDCYKTGHARLYSAAERWIIKRSCRQVICRSDNLAALLRADGVDAQAAGNVMMDTIPHGDYDAEARRSRPLAVTLLPGSRGPTRDNFALQVKALRLLPDAMLPDIFVAVASEIDIGELAGSSGLQRTAMLSAESADMGTLSDGRLTIHMARGAALGNLLQASDLVLSQAGTATTQALGLGRPSITFVSSSDRRSRFEAEQRYFGPARIETAATPESIAAALRRLLEDDAERRRLADIGRERVGGPGAIHAIIDALLD
jgi:uncharacterized protein (TIGR03492 family)